MSSGSTKRQCLAETDLLMILADGRPENRIAGIFRVVEGLHVREVDQACRRRSEMFIHPVEHRLEARSAAADRLQFEAIEGLETAGPSHLRVGVDHGDRLWPQLGKDRTGLGSSSSRNEAEVSTATTISLRF